jgi:hypothetical protein
MHEDPPDRSILGRIAIIVGVLAAIATIVGVAWTIFNRENTEVADYQNQVVATCDGVRAILTPASAEYISMKDLAVRKGPWVAVLRSNLERARITFDDLNTKPVPPSLAAQAQAAKDAQDAWYAASDQVIAGIEARRGNLIPIFEARVGREFSDTPAATRLNNAMTALAGKRCNVTDTNAQGGRSQRAARPSDRLS